MRRHPFVPLISLALVPLVAGIFSAAATVAGAPTDSTATSTVVQGPAAATAVAVRVSPPKASVPTTVVAGSTDGSASCPATGHAAIVDRANQRGWLCTNGTADAKFPITTAVSQPRPGTYHVYAKDKVTTSTFGGHFSYLDNFVAFTYGTNTGARIAFHAVPRNAAGAPYQPLDTVGTPAYYGASSGCIRVLPNQSQMIWDFLAAGD
ncbi:MAG: hypothetical protein JWN39_2173, partial [Ilumatobacteraceae bacterium]|nr:hypothetical protein [Ilumatobacteraceae bacterium]